MKNKMMIVDHDLVHCESLKTLLSAYGDCDIFMDSMEALGVFHMAHAESKPYDLILLDIPVQGIGGKELWASIREWETATGMSMRERVKIVLTTTMETRNALLKLKYLECEEALIKPVTQEKLTQILDQLGITPQKQRTAGKNKKQKIVIIDDDLISRTSLKQLLSAYGECDSFENAKEGLNAFFIAHAQGAPYEIMTLDINMPDMDGIQLLGTIRKWESLKKIQTDLKLKIIMITANTEIGNQLQSMMGDCEDYIIKPANNEKLAKTLDKIQRLNR